MKHSRRVELKNKLKRLTAEAATSAHKAILLNDEIKKIESLLNPDVLAQQAVKKACDILDGEHAAAARQLAVLVLRFFDGMHDREV